MISLRLNSAGCLEAHATPPPLTRRTTAGVTSRRHVVTPPTTVARREAAAPPPVSVPQGPWATDRVRASALALNETLAQVADLGTLLQRRHTELAEAHAAQDDLLAQISAGQIGPAELDAADRRVRAARVALDEAESLRERSAQRSSAARAVFERTAGEAFQEWCATRRAHHAPRLRQAAALLEEVRTTIVALEADASIITARAGRSEFADLLGRLGPTQLAAAIAALTTLLGDASPAPTSPAPPAPRTSRRAVTGGPTGWPGPVSAVAW